MVSNLVYRGGCLKQLEGKRFAAGHGVSSATITDKEVPMIIYRTEDYRDKVDDLLALAVSNVKRYQKSCGLMFISNENGELIDRLVCDQQRSEEIASIAIIISIKGEVGNNAEKIKKLNVSRIVVEDTEEGLSKKEIDNKLVDISRTYGVEMGEIGICNSPFSIDGRSCLCAVWVRKIMSDKGYIDGVCVPSAFHEEDHRCGCVRMIGVDELEEIADKKEEAKSEGKEKKEKKVVEKEVKGKNKITCIRGLF